MAQTIGGKLDNSQESSDAQTKEVTATKGLTKTALNIDLIIDDEVISVVNPLPTKEVISSDLEGLGDITVGTSEVEIVITGTPTGIRIRADNTNTGIIFVGKTGILSDGTNDFARLNADDEIVMSYNDAINGLYTISDTAAQKINVGALL